MVSTLPFTPPGVAAVPTIGPHVWVAADQRASTPSNAAQLLVPDKRHELVALGERKLALANALDVLLLGLKDTLEEAKEDMTDRVETRLQQLKQQLVNERRLLALLSPAEVLKRGYALVYHNGRLVRSA